MQYARKDIVMQQIHKFIWIAGALLLLIAGAVAEDNPRLPADVVSRLLWVTGAVRRVTVDDPSSATAKIVADFDDRGRLQQVDEYGQSGALISRAQFTYERFGLASIQWADAAGKPLRTFEQTFTDEGVRTSYYESDAAGRVLWKELFDVTDTSDHAYRRRFWLDLAPKSQLAESTRFIDCRGRCSLTTLLVDDQIKATWRIRRDTRNRLAKDDIDYMDLSFSYAQHFPDGSTYEHNFSNSQRTHTFSKRDASGDLLSVTVEPEGGHRVDTTYQYGPNHWLESEVTNESGKSSTTTFGYANDDQGNWVEQRITSPAGTHVVHRTIEYDTHPRH